MVSRVSLIVISMAVVTLSYDPCQGRDVYFEDKCYGFENLLGDFGSASNYCYKHGYSPVRIVNDSQNRAITDYAGAMLDDTYALFWVGGTDRLKTGDWRWADGSTMNYTNWENGKPLEDRHCLAVRVSTGKWVTELCTNKHQFVCEGDAYNWPTQSAYSCPPCNS